MIESSIIQKILSERILINGSYILARSYGVDVLLQNRNFIKATAINYEQCYGNYACISENLYWLLAEEVRYNPRGRHFLRRV